jgi:hypothetical protein
MNLSLTAFFNLRLAHITQVGYARCVQFETRSHAGVAKMEYAPESQCALDAGAAGAHSLIAGSSPAAGTTRKRRFVSGPGMASRRYNTAKNQKRRSPAFFQQAKAQLDLLTLTEES